AVVNYTSTLPAPYASPLAAPPPPALVAAVRAQVGRGTHFAQPTENAIVVAGELARRWGLPRWRFANSGTEATMDAVHLMRSYTGRDLIIKVEGGYHGHHDSVQVSVMPDADEAGPRDLPPLGPLVVGHPRGDHRPHADRRVQRPLQRRQAAGRAPRPGRGHDRRAGDDERRDHPPAPRLPRRAQRPPALPRCAADVR